VIVRLIEPALSGRGVSRNSRGSAPGTMKKAVNSRKSGRLLIQDPPEFGLPSGASSR
jgi:hypothetical protein